VILDKKGGELKKISLHQQNVYIWQHLQKCNFLQCQPPWQQDFIA